MGRTGEGRVEWAGLDGHSREGRAGEGRAG